MTSLALKDAIDSRLNYRFFFSKLNCVLFAQCIIFCRTNRAHWRSVIDSQLFMIKNKPTNSQRRKVTYLEHNFAFSPDLHFPILKLFILPKGSFSLVRHTVLETTWLITYSLKWVLKYGAPALRFARKCKTSFLSKYWISACKEGFLFVCLFCFTQVYELKSTRRSKAKIIHWTDCKWHVTCPNSIVN